MRRVWVSLVVVFSLCVAAQADTLIEPPNGFWIRGASRASGGLYGPTDQSANWNIAQWATPEADLPPFEQEPCPAEACFLSENTAISVSVEREADGSLQYDFWQDGIDLACVAPNKLPKEFDLLAASNNAAVYPRHPSAGDISPTLDQISELRHRIAATPVDLQMEDSCPVTRGQLITAVVLRNDVAKPAQIFFYHLRLFSRPAPGGTLWWWAGEANRSKRGDVSLLSYGFGDNLSSFGETEAVLGEEKELDVDLLPRLTELISSGEHNLDPDVSHWRVSATYHGQTIWGAVELRSKWSGFELSSEPMH